MSEDSFFSGNERLQPFPALGRPMRAAAPDQLAQSDGELLRQRLREGARDDAIARLELIAADHAMMVWVFGEWSLQSPVSFARHVSGGDERATTEQAFEQWKQDAASLRHDEGAASIVDRVTQLVDPATLGPRAADELRAALEHGERHELHDLADAAGAGHAELRQQIESGQMAQAADSVSRAFDLARAAHDALGQWVATYAAVALQRHGQPAAETVIQKSFSECSFHAGLFELAGALPPEQLAAFLAEHLRAHFSGEGREGSVRVVEEEDRYRLVFDPCGSGGAIRRRLAQAGRLPDRLPEASPMTWGRAGEVPAYCTHCAFNEMHSIDLFGYPLLVTEFDPDDTKPCGWTVYKHPEAIPARYFERVGRKRGVSE